MIALVTLLALTRKFEGLPRQKMWPLRFHQLLYVVLDVSCLQPTAVALRFRTSDLPPAVSRGIVGIWQCLEQQLQPNPGRDAPSIIAHFSIPFRGTFTKIKHSFSPKSCDVPDITE